MKLSSSELRIGNYMQDKKMRLCEVLQLSTDLDQNKISAIKGALTTFPLSPIPLTEEWLVKFGVEPMEIHGGCTVFKLGILHLLKSANLSYGCSFDPEDNHSWFTEIYSVHQLQNLYFALTSEELTIKESK